MKEFIYSEVYSHDKDEPKKFIFCIGPSETVCIIEIGPIMYTAFDWETGKTTGFEFVTQEKFKEIIAFHDNTDNHCPMLKQGWIGLAIDIWEDMSDFIIYDTKEEAEKAASSYLENYLKDIKPVKCG